MDEHNRKEPCGNKAPDNWDSKTRYEYLKKMSAAAISVLEENGFMLTNKEADTFLKLFATEFKFKWHINSRESSF